MEMLDHPLSDCLRICVRSLVDLFSRPGDGGSGTLDDKRTRESRGRQAAHKSVDGR